MGVWSPSPRWPGSYQERSSSRPSLGVRWWTWWSLEGPPAQELRFRTPGAKQCRLWRRAGHQESITVSDVKQRRHLPLVWSQELHFLGEMRLNACRLLSISGGLVELDDDGLPPLPSK